MTRLSSWRAWRLGGSEHRGQQNPVDDSCTALRTCRTRGSSRSRKRSNRRR